MAERKPFLLRIDAELHDALQRWTADDLRSLNAQLEWLLRRAVGEAGRAPKAARPGRGRGDDVGEFPWFGVASGPCPEATPSAPGIGFRDLAGGARRAALPAMLRLAVLCATLVLGACGFEPGEHVTGGGDPPDPPGGANQDAAEILVDAEPVGPGSPDGAPGAFDAPEPLPPPDARPAPRPDATILTCEDDDECPKDHRCRENVCKYERSGGGGD